MTALRAGWGCASLAALWQVRVRPATRSSPSRQSRRPRRRGNSRRSRIRHGSRLGLALLLVILLAAASPGGWRWGVLLVAGWTLLRAPVGPAALFSPATFYRPVVGVFGTSAGSLLVAGVVVLVAAGALWRRGVKRTWWGWSRYITDPRGAVRGALFRPRYRAAGEWRQPRAVGLVASGACADGDASFCSRPRWCAARRNRSASRGRCPGRAPGPRWPPSAACGCGARRRVAGVVHVPLAPRARLGDPPRAARWALTGMAVVAGTAAALIAWGAAVEGRLSLATPRRAAAGPRGRCRRGCVARAS